MYLQKVFHFRPTDVSVMKNGPLKALYDRNDVLGDKLRASTEVASLVGAIPKFFSCAELSNIPPTPPPSSISSPPRISVDSVETSFPKEISSNYNESKNLLGLLIQLQSQ